MLRLRVEWLALSSALVFFFCWLQDEKMKRKGSLDAEFDGGLGLHRWCPPHQRDLLVNTSDGNSQPCPLEPSANVNLKIVKKYLPF